MSRRVTVVPSARRLMESLRDIGYDLPAAVADLVDNCLDAGAERIDITVDSEGPETWLRIVDDGVGMTSGELDDAMRYGSSGVYGDDDLGHFGLGLKTGSLSQCRRLTVVSRRRPRARLEARRWDLDDVAERDAWDLEAPLPSQLPDAATEPLRGRSGTTVLWEKLDRVLALRNPSGASAGRTRETMVREIEGHLAMVFHRFISGEWADGEAHVVISVNGRIVEAWDPFARSEPRTRVLPRQVIPLTVAGDASARLVVQPYVLPSQTHFTSPAAHHVAAGPNRWNRQQGLYVYRRERLIQSGGWNRLRTLDEHAKLARIAVDLPIGHEDLFGINVAKMSLALPESVRAPLRTLASAVVNEAQRSYREHLHQATPPAEPPTVPDDAATAARVREERAASISGDWPLILSTVNETLVDHPEVRDRLLLRLVNAIP